MNMWLIFSTMNDEILVNEIAPRVHNRGHLTIESSFTNQFELNQKIPIPIANGEYWNPRNFDGKEDGSDMTLREGLTQSTNLIAASLIA